MQARSFAGLVIAAAVAGCASAPVDVPANLKPGSGEKKLATLSATGVQVYQCRAKPGAAGEYEWAFVAPEADLADASGKPAGKHYEGPHWEAPDGSKVVGKVKARADAPAYRAIPWLLLSTTSDGPEGAFSKVTSIQRVNTAGGVAPDACTKEDEGYRERVRYTADYILYVPR
jgi:hypothetical protein